MPAQLRTLNRAMSKTSGPAPTWGEVMCELWPVIATPLTGDDERLLLELLRHEGRLRLVANDELPHSLTPEDMLKSLAVQALGKWTRLTYLTEMQRLELLASSPELATIVRSVIEDAKVARVVPRGEDAIADAEVELPAAEEEKWGWISLAQPQRPAVKPGNRQKMYAAKAVARQGVLNYIPGWQRRKTRRKEEYEYA